MRALIAVRIGRVQSRLCCGWPSGAGKVAVLMEEVRHVRHPSTPQQAVVRLLSELIQRQLLQPACKEVADEAR
jgi:hypothetical protein